MEHEAAETVPATPGASDGRDTNESSHNDEPDDEPVLDRQSTADSMSSPDMEDLRRREVQLAKKRHESRSFGREHQDATPDLTRTSRLEK